jgi:hypothetical protein
MSLHLALKLITLPRDFSDIKPSGSMSGSDPFSDISVRQCAARSCRRMTLSGHQLLLQCIAG